MKKKVILGFVLACLCSVAFATPNPLPMLQRISDQMIASLKANRSKFKKHPTLVHQLVNRIVVPHADVLGMSRSVLGRNAWMKASKAQRKAFTKEFKRVVIRTYASALNAYKDETVKFNPIRGGYQGRKRVRVQSKIIRSDGPPIAVNYRLALKKGEWKIYDLNVEGVSLLQSFRSQIAAKLSQGKSIDQVTRDLKHHKRKKKKRPR